MIESNLFSHIWLIHEELSYGALRPFVKEIRGSQSLPKDEKKHGFCRRKPGEASSGTLSSEEGTCVRRPVTAPGPELCWPLALWGPGCHWPRQRGLSASTPHDSLRSTGTSRGPWPGKLCHPCKQHEPAGTEGWFWNCQCSRFPLRNLHKDRLKKANFLSHQINSFWGKQSHKHSALVLP